jgi:hypothetical protein
VRLSCVELLSHPNNIFVTFSKSQNGFIGPLPLQPFCYLCFVSNFYMCHKIGLHTCQ